MNEPGLRNGRVPGTMLAPLALDEVFMLEQKL